MVYDNKLYHLHIPEYCRVIPLLELAIHVIHE